VEWWQAAILGLVEGVTEYLPVSSTGHLIVASSLMGLDDPSLKRSLDAFNIVIQGGAILAVLGLYRKRVAQMTLGLLGKNPAGLRLAIRIIIAFIPAAVLGVLLNDFIEESLFFTGPVLAALALGGVYMIAIDRWRMKNLRAKRDEGNEDEGPDLDSMSLKSALIIGLIQCIAMWPGTSRSMMTITAGVMTGLKPRHAAEFSFLLGLPTLGGACIWKLQSNIVESQKQNLPNMFEVFGASTFIVGLAVATVSAVIAVRWLVGFLNKNGLEAFGWYRIVLAVVLGGLIWAGLVTVGTAEPANESQAIQNAID
jgi:undecaprenyl-diphosphatase